MAGRAYASICSIGLTFAVWLFAAHESVAHRVDTNDNTQEGLVLANRYSIGKVLKFNKGKGCKAHPSLCSKLGVLPKGVYGQVFGGKRVLQTDSALMPVELVKLFSEKHVLDDYKDMVLLINAINVGESAALAAAQIIEDFKERFHTKGVNVFFATVGFDWECCFAGVLGCKTCTEWHYWIEYANIADVGEDYRPMLSYIHAEYDKRFLTMADECKIGNSYNLVKYVAQLAGQKSWKDCGGVAGAIGRMKTDFPGCKCKGKNEKVFCGGNKKAVAKRKFNINSVLSLEGCSKKGVYCSSHPCLPPDAPP